MGVFAHWWVIGLVLASPISSAQQTVERGNAVRPHQPPAWFVSMLRPVPVKSPDSTALPPLPISVVGVPVVVRPRYVCRFDVVGDRLLWQFCEM